MEHGHGGHGNLHTVTLADDRSHSEVFSGQEYFANYGHCVVAESGGENVLLWTSPYIIKKGQYIVDEATILQTTLIHGRYSPEEKGRMHDNSFISTGWNFPDYHKLDELKITEKDNKITWALAGREFSGKPPVWQVKGAHAGVSLDLTMKALCPAFLYWSAHKDLKKTGKAVYEQYCTAEGVIETKEKKFPIKGYACHEHVVTGPQYNQVDTMSAPGFQWHLGYSPQLKYHVFVQPKASTGYGWAIVGDEVIPYADPKDVRSEEVEYWLDPRSGCRVPCKWHISMRTNKGILDVTVGAYARAYYFYIRKTGYVLIYWFLASANGAFIFPDGKTVRADGMQCGIEIGRTFLDTR